ncbi:MAG: amidohydrolase family protein [Candidatus Aquicultor sp.]
MFDSSARTLVKADAIVSPGKGFITNRSLILKNGSIERIAESGDSEPGMHVVDFTGFVLSPLFCDYHLHFFKSGLDRIDETISALAASGVFRVFEAGDGNAGGIKAKHAVNGSPAATLDIKTSGFALYKKGGYGSFLGTGVEGADEARPLIDKLAALGVDFIKVINAGIFIPETGEVTPGGFENDELARIIAYANDKGLPVMCHANGDRAVRDAVDGGASAIVHGFSASDEILSVMARQGVDLIPTINALFSLRKQVTDTKALTGIDDMVNEHLGTVQRASALGVKVLPGSDSGPDFIPYGTAYSEELLFLQKAGLSDEAILSSAASVELEEGGSADFLVLDGLSVKNVCAGGVL